MGFDSKCDLPLLPSCWGASITLGRGISFFGGIQHSPVDGCSAASCNFGVLAGEDERTFFYSTIFEDNPVEKEKWKTGGIPGRERGYSSCVFLSTTLALTQC